MLYEVITTPLRWIAGLVMAGASNVVIDRIALAAGGGYAMVSGLRVKQIGTAEDTNDIASISFWRDTNKDGTPDSSYNFV